MKASEQVSKLVLKNWNKLLSKQKSKFLELYYLFLDGADRDAHGCIGSAGYEWCEVKVKCYRRWEEKCEVDAPTKPGKKNKVCSDKRSTSYICQVNVNLNLE